MATVLLKKHSPFYRLMFLKERILIRLFLRNQAGEVAHFGSTSIPGMLAKPVIDIQVGVLEFETAFRCVGLLEQLGYDYHGENAKLRQYYFTKGDPVRYRLYLLEPSNDLWANRTRFRDLLMRDRTSFRQYELLKRYLAIRFPHDIHSYQAGKRQFIDERVGPPTVDATEWKCLSVWSREP